MGVKVTLHPFVNNGVEAKMDLDVQNTGEVVAECYKNRKEV